MHDPAVKEPLDYFQVFGAESGCGQARCDEFHPGSIVATSMWDSPSITEPYAVIRAANGRQPRFPGVVGNPKIQATSFSSVVAWSGDLLDHEN
jgi:hypothetical protein